MIGGRCLNYACIPAKAVLRVADVLDEVRDADEFGIKVAEPEVDFAAVDGAPREGRQDADRRRRRPVQEEQDRLHRGPRRADRRRQRARRPSKDGDEIDGSKCIVLATGSVKKPIPGTKFGGRVIGTEEAWALDGAAARRWSSSAPARRAPRSPRPTRASASRCMLFEALDRVLPTEDADISKLAERGFKKQGIEVHTGTLVENVETTDTSCTFSFGDEAGEADWLVIAAGRGPDVEGLGLDEAGVKLDEHGLIEVDGALRTSAQGRLRDRRPRPRPGARAQGLRRGHHRRRGRRRPGDAPDRVRRHPARDVLHPQRRLASGSPRSRRARRATTSSSARSSTARSAPARSTATAAASSRSSATSATASCSAATSSARRRPSSSRSSSTPRRSRAATPRSRASSTATRRCPRPSWRRHARRMAGSSTASTPSRRALLLRPRPRPAAYVAAERALHEPPGRRVGPGARPRACRAPRAGRRSAAPRSATSRWRRSSAPRAEQGLQPLRWPDPFPFDSLFAMRVATYAKQIGRTVAFALAAFRQAFAGGRSLAEPDNVVIAAAACEMHPAAVIKAAELRGVGDRLDEATARAIASACATCRRCGTASAWSAPDARQGPLPPRRAPRRPRPGRPRGARARRPRRDHRHRRGRDRPVLGPAAARRQARRDDAARRPRDDGGARVLRALGVVRGRRGPAGISITPWRMVVVEAPTLGEGWLAVSRAILEHGALATYDGQSTRELLRRRRRDGAIDASAI